MEIYRHFDIGGGKFRKAAFNMYDRKISLRGKPVVIDNFKFNSQRDLLEQSYSAITQDVLNSKQRTFVYSVAGPISEDRRTIIKLTNHTKIEHTNIPFAESLESMYFSQHKKRINIVVINDGEAGAYAEFSPLGALSGLKDGELGMAFIIGNGVGGRLYKKIGDGLEAVPGAFEPGHRPVPMNLLEQMNIIEMLQNPKTKKVSFKCGCGIKGGTSSGMDVCFESITKGPALKKMLNGFIRAIRISDEDPRPIIERLCGFPPILSSTELKQNPLLQHVVKKMNGDTFSLSMRSAAKNIFTNEMMTRAMEKTNGKEPISNAVLSKEGALIARGVQLIQCGYTDPITFALIGGVGISLGKYIIPHINNYVNDLDVKHQKSVWTKKPVVVAGKFPSDETNLWGDMYYMINYDKGEK
jgi:hypothetical protein